MEAYPVWQRHCGEKIKYDFLFGKIATSEERRKIAQVIHNILKLQGKIDFLPNLQAHLEFASLIVFFKTHFLYILYVIPELSFDLC